MAEIVRITVVTGPHRSSKYCLVKSAGCTIGRDTSCEVALSGHFRDGAISRKHCRLDVELPMVQVRDLQSRNGTYVNGRPVKEETGEGFAGPGDYLTVGGTTLLVETVECPLEDAHLEECCGECQVRTEEGVVLVNCAHPCGNA